MTFIPRSTYSRALCTGLAAACVPSIALAQTPSTTSLAPVVVTAARYQQEQVDALPHTTTISSTAIRNSQAPDLPTLLSAEAGIQVTRNGGLGSTSGLFMRGARSVQTLVLIDGIPMSKQDATGTVSLEHLALDQIDRVEIVRGNVSAIYGSGAIGGVVQIFTRASRASQAESADTVAVHGSAGLTLGSQGRRSANAGLSGEYKGTFYGVSASGTKSDGFSALNTQQVPAANADRDGYSNTSASAFLTHRFNADHLVGGRVLSADGQFDYDSAFGAPADVHTGRTKLLQYALHSEHRFLPNWKTNLQIASNRETNTSVNGGLFGYSDRFVTNVSILQWNNAITVGQHLTFTAGAERQNQRLEADDGFGGLYDYGRKATSLYGGGQLRAGAFSLQANVRHDRYDGNPSDVSKTTGLVAAGFSLSPAWRITAMASTGFNMPSLGYLYAPFFGNAALKPEESKGGELGLQYKDAETLVNWRLFTTRVRNEFDYDFIANTLANLSSTRNLGLETSASGRVRLQQGLHWNASLTLQKPEDANTGAQLTRRARWLANLGATQKLGSVQVGADVRLTGKRRDTAATPTAQLGGYALLDVRAQYNITPELAAVARVENALARNYQTVWGYNAPGRTFQVGLRYHR
jgi:vitamin B12 transporter